MHRIFLPLIAVSLLAVGAATPAQAASFDCVQARKPDEVAVCKDRDLSELDTEMGALWYAYRAFPFLMGMSGNRMDEAHEFLDSRSKCGADVACLRKIYQARITALKEGIQWGMKNYTRDNGPPADPASLPAGVEAVIGNYTSQCRQMGGMLAAGADRPWIMAADFDGDGKPDYLLNPENMKCSAAATAFCGNGGCNIYIAVSGNDYQNPVQALGGEPTILQRSSGTNVELEVSNFRCNIPNAGGSACWVTYSWKDGKVSETYQARPRSQ